MMTTVEVKLRELETRVMWLEQAVQELCDPGRLGPAGVNVGKGLSERTRLLAKLKAGGLIRDLTPNEQALAAEWNALPEDEKQAIIRELHNLKPGSMLSEIVIESRS